MKFFKFSAIVLALLFVVTLSACKDTAADVGASPSDKQTSSEGDGVEETVILVRDIALRMAETKSSGAGTAVEKLSLTPLTDSSSYTVKDAVNYKWIAYDNFTLHQQYDEPTTLAKGGYILYVELPACDFDHEMYFEFFAKNEKVSEYSGEVAYTESDKTWYSLSLGENQWQEHTTAKYKLGFADGGKEFKGYIFIPAESLTYRYESDSLSDVCVYVKTGVETGKGETDRGMTFTVSTVLPVESFDPTVTVAQSKKGRVDLSTNTLIQ